MNKRLSSLLTYAAVFTAIHVGCNELIADDPVLIGTWEGIASIARSQPDLSSRNWRLVVEDGRYSETHEFVREGAFSINADATPAQINLNFHGLGGDKGIYRIEDDTLTLNYGDERPDDFNDIDNSLLLVLTRNDNPEWATLRSAERPISGSWTLKSFTSFGTSIQMEKWGVETFVFGTDRVVTSIVHTENGELRIDSSQSPSTMVFKPKVGDEYKRQFWFKDGHLFVSWPSNKAHMSIYRRKAKQ